MIKVTQTRMFARKVKKFSSQEKTILDGDVRRIIANPSIGQEKRGTLKGVFVHKFIIHTNQFLLAYRCDPKALDLIMIGSHENYYRDLDSYLKG